mmetsp:Transcript_28556/g.64417  ORF Transcript_28556/g.64417 Transcript_28556/m.64417 type:complete len:80 (-) Transcript_28556:594-833(-)
MHPRAKSWGCVRFRGLPHNRIRSTAAELYAERPEMDRTARRFHESPHKVKLVYVSPLDDSSSSLELESLRFMLAASFLF